MSHRDQRIAFTLTVLCGLAGASASDTAAQSAETGYSLGFPDKLAADPSGALFVVDRGTASQYDTSVTPTILRIDPDGALTLVADSWRGSGPHLAIAYVNGMDLFLEPDGRLLFGLLLIEPDTGDRVSLPPIASPGFGVLSKIPESESSLLLGGTRGLVRYDRSTGDFTLLSGCPSSSSCAPVGGGPTFVGITALAPWTEGLVMTAGSGLISVDLSTGDRTLVSGRGRGIGPNVDEGLRAIVIEPSGHILAAKGSSLLRVDPDTGDRVVVSDESTGTGPALRSVEDMVLEAAGTLALADSLLGALVRVDLATGDRTLLYGGPIGTGPLPSCATAAEWQTGTRIVLADCDGGVLGIDLSTGNRRVVSDGVTGAGPLLESVRDIVVEPSGMLLVVDGSSLKRVHPATGDRTTIAKWRGRTHDAAALELESANSALVGDDGADINVGFLVNIPTYSALRLVDLATGRSEVVAGGGLLSRSRGQGPALNFGEPFLTLETPNAAATAQLYPGRNETWWYWKVGLFLVDLASGDRTLVSGPDRGAGESLQYPVDIAMDGSGAWWVADRSRNCVYRMDPATGDRTLVSGRERGRGPQFENLTAVLLDQDGMLIVVNEGSTAVSVQYPFTAVMRVDPATGDRTVLSRF